LSDLKYELIAEFVRDQIASEQLRVGDQIPSGRELAERFDCSRVTVVKAMETLRSERLIVARQGSGFYVTSTPMGRLAGGRRGGTSRMTGALTFRRIGDPARIQPPEHVARQLGVPPDALVLARARLMLLKDGSPASFVTAYFPPDIADAAPLLARTTPLPGGTTRHIARSTGRSPVRGVDVTTVRLATDDEARLLQLAPPPVVAVTVHTAYDHDDRALVCEEGVVGAALAERVDEYPMGS
jgi:DNA-binding GntR family transcriptional regulator